MSTLTSYVAFGALAVVVSVSAVAIGRHHRPFSPPPAKSHLAPRIERQIVIEQHAVIEKAPVAATAS